jgi:hypothetical protein
MVQDIISYLIIGVAFGILIYRILQFFNITEKKQAKCSGCASGCSLKEQHVVRIEPSLIKKINTGFTYNLLSAAIVLIGFSELNTKLPATNISAPAL